MSRVQRNRPISGDGRGGLSGRVVPWVFEDEIARRQLPALGVFLLVVALTWIGSSPYAEQAPMDEGERERTAPATGDNTCELCNGSGVCPTCNGSAAIIRADETTTCPDCTGGVCPTCNGSGRSTASA